jgi:hypothetical protein
MKLEQSSVLGYNFAISLQKFHVVVLAQLGISSEVNYLASECAYIQTRCPTRVIGGRRGENPR